MLAVCLIESNDRFRFGLWESKSTAFKRSTQHTALTVKTLHILLSLSGNVKAAGEIRWGSLVPANNNSAYLFHRLKVREPHH